MGFKKALAAALAICLSVPVIGSMGVVKADTAGWATNYENVPEITFGKTYDLNFEDGGSDRYAKFTVPQRGYIDVTYDFPIYKSNNKPAANGGWTTIYVTSPTKTKLMDLEINKKVHMYGEEKPSSTQKYRIPLQAGSYIINFHDSSVKEGSYSIKYTQANDWEQEDNSTIDKAEPISFGQKLNANLFLTENDYFSFTTTNTNKIKVYLGNSDALIGYTNLQLHGYRGNETGNVKINVTKAELNFDSSRNEYYIQFNPEGTGKMVLEVESSGLTLDGLIVPYTIEVVQDGAQTNVTPAKAGTIYRLYNPADGDHVYTTDEADMRAKTGSGWNLEPSPGISAGSDGVAIYRIVNVATGENLFTSDKNEVNVQVASGAWRAFNGGAPVFYGAKSGKGFYRLYNPHSGNYPKTAHHFTADPNEVKVLTTQQGWQADNNGQPLFYLAQ